MSFALNNIVTIDAHSAVCQLTCLGAVKANVQIMNASVFMRPTFRDPIDGTTTVGAEVFLAPGFYSLARPLNKIEFRSGATGVVARVTCEALLAQEA